MSKGTKRELSHVFTSVYYNKSFYNWTKYPNHCILINILDKSNLDLKATYFGCISFLSYTVFILPWQSPYPPEDKVRSVTFRWETQLAPCGLRVLQKLMTMMMITGNSGNSYISWPLKKKSFGMLRDCFYHTIEIIIMLYFWHISDFVRMKTNCKSEIRILVSYSSQCYRQKPDNCW